jgi:hypothetical protein
MIAVSVDPADGPDVLTEYQKKNDYPWTVVPGNREIVERYGVLTTMSKFGIDRAGTIALKGGHTVEDARAWERMFEELLRR